MHQHLLDAVQKKTDCKLCATQYTLHKQQECATLSTAQIDNGACSMLYNSAEQQKNTQHTTEAGAFKKKDRQVNNAPHKATATTRRSQSQSHAFHVAACPTRLINTSSMINPIIIHSAPLLFCSARTSSRNFAFSIMGPSFLSIASKRISIS